MMKNLLYLAILFFSPLSNLLAQADTVTVEANICEGEIFLFNNQELTDSGTYVAVYQNQSGGDSVVMLNLAVHPTDETEAQIDICQEEYSPYLNIMYPNSGEFTEVWPMYNQYGCDSMVTAQISVHPIELICGWGIVPYGTVIEGITLTDPNQCYVITTYDTTEWGCLQIWSMTFGVMPSAASELEKSTNFQAFPNPFHNDIRLKFELPERMTISASLLDASGRQVAVLMENKTMVAGSHELSFPQDNLSSGFYLLHFQADDKSLVKKMTKL